MNDNSCHRLWSYVQYHIERGHFSFCCKTPWIPIKHSDLNLGPNLFDTHSEVMKRRSEMLNKEYTSACNYCWQLESRGAKTPRVPTDLSGYSTNAGALTRVDLYASNICDSKCIYCNEFYSSQWESEKKMHSKDFIPIKSEVDPRLETIFLDWIAKNIATIELFSFLGGEPLLVEKTYEYLEKIIDIIKHSSSPSSVRKRIMFYSNMNTPEKQMDRFLKIANQIKDLVTVEIVASGEGAGEQFEYIRHGTSWDIWNRNLYRVVTESDMIVRLSPAHNILCVPSMSKYLKVWDDLCSHRPVLINNTNLVGNGSLPLTMGTREMVPYYENIIDVVTNLPSLGNEERQNTLIFYKNILNLTAKNPSMYHPSNNNYAIEFFRLSKRLCHRHDKMFTEIFPEFTELYLHGKSLDNQ